MPVPGTGLTDFVDPYLDPATGILHNLVGARTRAVLDQAEADLVQARLLDLPAAKVPPTGDLTELRGMDRATFIQRLAHHYDQLNYIHPFREGNGRAQRAFWDRVAGDAGWRLNWVGVTGEVNDAACRAAAEQRDLTSLIEMFERIVTPLGPA